MLLMLGLIIASLKLNLIPIKFKEYYFNLKMTANHEAKKDLEL